MCVCVYINMCNLVSWSVLKRFGGPKNHWVFRYAIQTCKSAYNSFLAIDPHYSVYVLVNYFNKKNLVGLY